MSKALSTSAKRYFSFFFLLQTNYYNIQFISGYKKNWQKSHWIPHQTAGIKNLKIDAGCVIDLHIFQCWTQR